MAKTRTEILDMALREIRVLAAGEPATAEDYVTAGDAYDAAVSEMTTTQGLAAFDPTPDGVASNFARVVAADIAHQYEAIPPMSRAAAIGRIRAFLVPDDRDDARDLDDDGIITDAEIAASKRAAFY